MQAPDPLQAWRGRGLCPLNRWCPAGRKGDGIRGLPDSMHPVERQRISFGRFLIPGSFCRVLCAEWLASTRANLLRLVDPEVVVHDYPGQFDGFAVLPIVKAVLIIDVTSPRLQSSASSLRGPS